MHCHSCGSKIDRGDRFCRMCGNRLAGEGAPSPGRPQRPAAVLPEPSRAPGSLRRRSIRVTLRVPVVVRWQSRFGTPQVEAAETRIVNAHGCLVWLKADLPRETKVELLNNSTGRVRRARIAWHGGKTENGHYKVSVELDEPDVSFWGPDYAGFLVWASSEST